MPQQDGRRVANTIKSIPYPPGRQPIIWKMIIPKKFSHCCKGSEPHVRLSSLGIQQRDWKSGIWLWRPVGFDYRTFTGLEDTETPPLDGTNKILCIPRPRWKVQWPHRRLNQIYQLMLKGFLWRSGLVVACHGDGGKGNSSPGRGPWHKSSWKSFLTLP